MVDHVDARTLKAWLSDAREIALLDAREAGEFADGHLLFAVPIPYSTFEQELPRLVPNLAARIVICDAGSGVAEFNGCVACIDPVACAPYVCVGNSSQQDLNRDQRVVPAGTDEYGRRAGAPVPVVAGTRCQRWRQHADPRHRARFQPCEASGVVLARELLNGYRAAGGDERRAFFRFLAESLQPDREHAIAAAAAFAKDPSDTTLTRLQAAVESPRQEFFRRLNLAPGATAEIIAMRRDLLRLPKGDPSLAAALAQVDGDLMHLLYSWFNRGFLVLRRIDWQTPAAILEKIIAYEAVHQIQGWDDLRRRLDPADRRCFGFFHPSLIDEPLIFVEVALMGAIPQGIADVLEEERKAPATEHAPTTAVFYSISNCQEGLRGISFGNFLIKQVAEELAKEHPTLKTFVTLSPVPHFARWLDRVRADAAAGIVTAPDRNALAALNDPEWIEQSDVDLDG